MKLEGSAEIPRPAAEVFARLLDPECLRRCLPGCESMQASGAGAYVTVVKAGVGPVKGTFRGRITLGDVRQDEGYTLAIEGQSPVGHVHGQATVRLEPAGAGTRVRYGCEARIAGLLATVGSRLLDLAARKIASEFFARLEQEIAGPGSGRPG